MGMDVNRPTGFFERVAPLHPLSFHSDQFPFPQLLDRFGLALRRILVDLVPKVRLLALFRPRTAFTSPGFGRFCTPHNFLLALSVKAHSRLSFSILSIHPSFKMATANATLPDVTLAGNVPAGVIIHKHNGNEAGTVPRIIDMKFCDPRGKFPFRQCNICIPLQSLTLSAVPLYSVGSGV
jgi:hypothetical protein